MDRSLPSVCILHPFLSLQFLYLPISFSPKNFLLYFSLPSFTLLICRLFISNMHLLLTLVNSSLFHSSSLILLFFANLSCSSTVCLSFSGSALQCSWCWQWHTLTHQTLTPLMCLSLVCCYILQISDATCQVVHEEMEARVRDAGSWGWMTADLGFAEITFKAAGLESSSKCILHAFCCQIWENSQF